MPTTVVADGFASVLSPGRLEVVATFGDEHLGDYGRRHQPAVREMFGRTGLLKTIGEENIFWSADQAIMADMFDTPYATNPDLRRVIDERGL